VVKDILPKITNENFGFIEYNEEEEDKAHVSKSAMLVWLK
jgi:hypothetical protein